MNINPKTLVALALFACACGSAVDTTPGDGDPAAPTCSEGVLVVEGPVVRIMARYPEASPPDRLLAHSTSPGMLVIVEAGGWLWFDLYEPVPAGGVATIETYDVSTGESLCPLEVSVDR